MRTENECCNAEYRTARPWGDVPSLAFLFLCLLMAMLGCFGIGMAGLGLVDLLRVLWEAMP